MSIREEDLEAALRVDVADGRTTAALKRRIDAEIGAPPRRGLIRRYGALVASFLLGALIFGAGMQTLLAGESREPKRAIVWNEPLKQGPAEIQWESTFYQGTTVTKFKAYGSVEEAVRAAGFQPYQSFADGMVLELISLGTGGPDRDADVRSMILVYRFEHEFYRVNTVGEFRYGADTGWEFQPKQDLYMVHGAYEPPSKLWRVSVGEREAVCIREDSSRGTGCHWTTADGYLVSVFGPRAEVVMDIARTIRRAR